MVTGERVPVVIAGRTFELVRGPGIGSGWRLCPVIPYRLRAA